MDYAFEILAYLLCLLQRTDLTEGALWGASEILLRIVLLDMALMLFMGWWSMCSLDMSNSCTTLMLTGPTLNRVHSLDSLLTLIRRSMLLAKATRLLQPRPCTVDHSVLLPEHLARRPSPGHLASLCLQIIDFKCSLVIIHQCLSRQWTICRLFRLHKSQ